MAEVDKEKHVKFEASHHDSLKLENLEESAQHSDLIWDKAKTMRSLYRLNTYIAETCSCLSERSLHEIMYRNKLKGLACQIEYLRRIENNQLDLINFIIFVLKYVNKDIIHKVFEEDQWKKHFSGPITLDLTNYIEFCKKILL